MATNSSIAAPPHFPQQPEIGQGFGQTRFGNWLLQQVQIDEENPCVVHCSYLFDRQSSALSFVSAARSNGSTASGFAEPPDPSLRAVDVDPLLPPTLDRESSLDVFLNGCRSHVPVSLSSTPILGQAAIASGFAFSHDSAVTSQSVLQLQLFQQQRQQLQQQQPGPAAPLYQFPQVLGAYPGDLSLGSMCSQPLPTFSVSASSFGSQAHPSSLRSSSDTSAQARITPFSLPPAANIGPSHPSVFIDQASYLCSSSQPQDVECDDISSTGWPSPYYDSSDNSNHPPESPSSSSEVESACAHLRNAKLSPKVKVEETDAVAFPCLDSHPPITGFQSDVGGKYTILEEGVSIRYREHKDNPDKGVKKFRPNRDFILQLLFDDDADPQCLPDLKALPLLLAKGLKKNVPRKWTAKVPKYPKEAGGRHGFNFSLPGVSRAELKNQGELPECSRNGRLSYYRLYLGYRGLDGHDYAVPFRGCPEAK